jgi:hypothetical protein
MSLYGPRQLAASFRTVRDNTIKVAEDVPELSYSYRATSENLSRWIEELPESVLAENVRMQPGANPRRKTASSCSWA